MNVNDDDHSSSSGASDFSDDDEEEDIAQRLHDQLWADISKAQAALSSLPPPALSPRLAALHTISHILSLAALDATIHSTLLHGNVLHSLEGIARTRVLGKGDARALHAAVQALVESDSLLTLPTKRKRAGDDERPSKRLHSSATTVHTLHTHLTHAIHVLSSSLPAPSSAIAHLQAPLHQIFLFAMSASSRSHSPHALHEICGLIQVLSVLHGIPLPSSDEPPTSASTCIYPCPTPPCLKSFARLTHLRTHLRTHSSSRPHRCSLCPASFQRSHDMKRHAKLHERKAWKCAGCTKMFSRRDAIKRHMNRAVPDSACAHALVTEVDLQETGETLRDDRLAKIWDSALEEKQPDVQGGEEGELDPGVLEELMARVEGLRDVLKMSVVARGAPVPLVEETRAPSLEEEQARLIRLAIDNATAAANAAALCPSDTDSDDESDDSE